MATHKNYVEWFWRNRDTIINTQLLPNQDEIFNLFSNKFHDDAEKDWSKGRVRLQTRWETCANACNEIHNSLWWDITNNEELTNLVKNIVNLDYWSLQDFFITLRKSYSNNPEILTHIDNICKQLKKMWDISEPHTTIKTED